jgi:hypothetical protein
VDAHIWRGYRPVLGQLSVGLLMQRADQAEQWATSVLNLLIADPAVKLDAVFRAPDVPVRSAHDTSLFRSLRNRRRAALFQAVRLRVRPACCFIDVEYDVERWTFTEEAREAIRKRNLDVLLWLDSHPLQGDCSGLARLGVWSFYFDEKPRAQKSCADIRIVSLQRHIEPFEKGELLASYTDAAETTEEFSKTADRLAERASVMLIRTFLDALECHDRFRDEAGPTQRSSDPDRSAQLKTPVVLKTPVGPRLSARARTFFPRSRQHKRSFVALRRKVPSADRPFDTSGFIELEEPNGSVYADPFLIEHEGKHWLFVREVPQGASKGRITCFEVLDNNVLSEAYVALEEPYNLAYPCVFEHGGNYFLLPDSAANRKVSLYRAIEFPHRWELVNSFVEGPAVVETTPLFLDGMWYFFTSTKEPGSETFLFCSAKLEGPWRYHPANPICSDARRAGSAGNLFYGDGKLIRPSRDCSANYGRSIAFNEVTRLSPGEYAERVVQRISPDWHPNLLETHTYNSDGMYEAISGMRFEK